MSYMTSHSLYSFGRFGLLALSLCQQSVSCQLTHTGGEAGHCCLPDNIDSSMGRGSSTARQLASHPTASDCSGLARQSAVSPETSVGCSLSITYVFACMTGWRAERRRER